MLFAVDIGSGFTKYARGGEKAAITSNSFPSIVTPSPDRETVFAMSENGFISFDGEELLTGEVAQRSGNPSKRLDTINEDWHGEKGWLALLYQAIANSFEPDEFTNNPVLQVATGLPQKIFGTHRKKLEERLARLHTFQSGSKTYELNIVPTIVPQAAGALIYCSLKDTSLLDSLVGIIDVGTFTTGLSVLDCGGFVEHKSTGAHAGMNDVFNELVQVLKEKHEYITDRAKMPEIAVAGSAMIKGVKIDLSESIKESALKPSRVILEKVNQTWGNGNDMQIFLTGGGSSAFLEHLQKEIPHIQLTRSVEPQYDVVLGMYSYIKSRGLR